MRQPSLARSLRVALLGLSLAFAALAGFGVAALYDSRQRYEDSISRAYELQSAAAGLVAAGVVEEAILRGQAAPGSRGRAERAFGDAARRANRLARTDRGSSRLVNRAIAAEDRGRRAATAIRLRRLAAKPDPLARPLGRARKAATGLARRQPGRRALARRQARARSRRAFAAILGGGGLALLVALALVTALTARMRRPLDDLVVATRRLAGGELGRRVQPAGPAELRQLASAFNAMSGDLAAAQARIESERERLEVIIASLGDALIVLDATGRVTAANPQASRLLPELVRAGSVRKARRALPPLTEALAGEAAVTYGDRTLAVTAARLGDDGATVWTVRDVSERTRLDRLKSEFVATASHELRSPLTSIKGFVELLGMTDELSARQRSYVDIVLRSTDRLVDLVNDLLDVARVEADHVELKVRAMDLAEPVAEAAELLAPRVAEKEQELELSLDGLPLALADPGRIRQVFANLLTNAHLYTDPGGRIAVRGRADGAWVEVDVSDTGPGMTAVELEHVFDRFYRGGAPADTPGSGLGLAIVKSLVDLHGGRIAVDSAPGHGTTFRVRLPRAG